MKKILMIGTVVILLAGQAFAEDVNATTGSGDFHADINSFADNNISAPVAATIPAGQTTTCKKASNKHKASMFTGGGTGNGVTGIAVKGAIMLSAFIYNKIIDYVEEECVTQNTKDEKAVIVLNNIDTKTQESQFSNTLLGEKITNGNQCESVGKKWEWNGAVNEWQCL